MAKSGAGQELIELFEKASNAADRAASEEGSTDAEEARCIDALHAMNALPVTTNLLMSTQIGKELRKLTKHRRSKIRTTAVDILDSWKKVVASEAVSSKNGESVKSPKSGSKSEQPKTAQEEKKKLKELPKTNDVFRDKTRQALMDAFSKVGQETEGETKQRANARDHMQVAVDVESGLFSKLGCATKGAGKTQYRSILFNLRDSKNPDLRRRVFLGEISPLELATMSVQDMASDRRKQENKQIKDKALFDCELGKQEATTDQFKCGKCGKRECTYTQKQIRSADEPMTTFVTCVNCNNRWKFC